MNPLILLLTDIYWSIILFLRSDFILVLQQVSMF